MAISWGYSPKTEKYIPLGDFPVDKYLIIAKQAIENLGWNLSHISESGLIAYTPISFQSYSEEIAIRIQTNFVIAKSECVGIQLLFNDYGKNDANLEKFFHEFEYVEYHLKDVWDESLAKYHEFIATQDDNYFEKAPLTVKNKIKNVFYLFIPRKGYVATPIFIYITIVYYFTYFLINSFAKQQEAYHGTQMFSGIIRDFWALIFSNNRSLVLQGQYWRLFTYQFIHVYFIHIFFNMYSLVYLGLMIEHKLGGKRFALIYLLSGFCGGLTSIMMHEVGFSIGASGSIMGLYGAFLALLASKIFEKNAAKALLISTGIVTVFTLLNGLSAGIDNAAHIGGLIAGFVFTYLLFNDGLMNFKSAKVWRYGLTALIFISFTVSVLVFTTNYQPKEFAKLEADYNQNAANYFQIFYIKVSTPTAEKLQKVNELGVKPWERNIVIIKQMKKLRLNEKDQLLISYYDKIATKSLNFVKVFRLEVEDNVPQYKFKLDQLMQELQAIKKEGSEKTGIYLR